MSNLFEGLDDVTLLESFENPKQTEFIDVPFGNHPVKLHKIAYKIVYDRPAFTFSFKVTSGDSVGGYINFKKYFDSEYSKKSAYEFLKSLGTDVVNPKKFATEETKEALAAEIKEATDGKIEYDLDYYEETSKNGKVYKAYKITGVYDTK